MALPVVSTGSVPAACAYRPDGLLAVSGAVTIPMTWTGVAGANFAAEIATSATRFVESSKIDPTTLAGAVTAFCGSVSAPVRAAPHAPPV